MTQNERWIKRYNEVKNFIETNKRNPSKHDDEERGKYLNWMKHNRKLYAAGGDEGRETSTIQRVVGTVREV